MMRPSQFTASAGASSANMAAFGQEYPNAKADQLAVNYRSTKEIVNLVVSLAPSIGTSQGMLPLRLTAARGVGNVQPQVPPVRYS